MNESQFILEEIRQPVCGELAIYYPVGKAYLRSDAMGYRPLRKRAEGIAALFTEPDPYIYPHDLIAGSMRSLILGDDAIGREEAKAAYNAFPNRYVNIDHFTPDYRTALTVGITGLLARIHESKQAHEGEPDRVEYLESMAITLEAFRTRLLLHARKAEELLGLLIAAA